MNIIQAPSADLTPHASGWNDDRLLPFISQAGDPEPPGRTVFLYFEELENLQELNTKKSRPKLENLQSEGGRNP
jgi:hypothetical protein